MMSVILNVALVCGLGYYHLKTKQQKKALPATASIKKSDKKYNVAILTPVTHPSLEQIENGFKETLQKSGEAKYNFTVFNANGKNTLLLAQAEEALQGDYDLLFTIAQNPTQIAKEISQKKKIDKPIVFAAVSNPVGIDLIANRKNSKNNLTGVEEINDFELQIDLLQELKADVKNILLLYNPSSEQLESDKKKLETILNKRNINLKTVEAYNTNEIYHKLSSTIEGNDVVMVLKDNTIVSGLEAVVKLCNRHNVTLLATDLDSPERGAVLGFGVKEYDFGVHGAQKALQILEKDKKPTEVPTTPVTDQKLRINAQMLESQALKLSDLDIFLYSFTEVL